MELSLNDLQSKANFNKVLMKVSKKASFALPAKPSLFEFELFKKDLLTKNRKFFLFYEDKCMFFQVFACF